MARAGECELLAIEPLSGQRVEIRRWFATAGEAEYADAAAHCRHADRVQIGRPRIRRENYDRDIRG